MKWSLFAGTLGAFLLVSAATAFLVWHANRPLTPDLLPGGAYNVSYGVDGMGRRDIEFSIRKRRYVMWRSEGQLHVIETWPEPEPTK